MATTAEWGAFEWGDAEWGSDLAESPLREREAGIPVEWGTTLRERDAGIPVEWWAMLAREGSLPAEWVAAVFRDAGIPVDVAALLARLGVLPAEWAGLEEVLRDSGLPTEWGAALRRDSEVPAEWTGGNAVVRAAGIPLEWGGLPPDVLRVIWDALTLLVLPLPVRWEVVSTTPLAALGVQWTLYATLATLPVAFRVVPDLETPFAADFQRPSGSVTETP